MIGKLLIANRGEIACRIAASARRMGIATVAVYSDADAGAAHVAAADEALRIGPAPAAQSYLDIAAVLAAAAASGADAVHPGYGFLSENAGFAEACTAAGVCFVGPPADAIRAMGSKRGALELMAAQGVPVLPGYRGEAQDDAALEAAAATVGFPLIIKPSAGGGGKGMQVVRDQRAMGAALATARRVARAAFGDETLILERYLERPRHIEIQVFADHHGGCIHLHERDCSVQRRHQKVVEEAPAPDLPQAVRAAMGAVAVQAAQAIGYRGAGTVEFLYDPDSSTFHFMEMNTRLQVEHPVTECITGIDLVEWQLRIAAGEALPLTQEQVQSDGHAIEVRLYAEDPERDFLPATGPVDWFRLPDGGGLRVDAGVRAGDAVSVHYDPMIAKLIVHGPDRAAAVARLARALSRTSIGPLANNLPFLRALTAHPEFRAGAVDTGFLARHQGDLQVPVMPAHDALLAACAHILSGGATDPASPWGSLRGFRLNLPPCQRMRLRVAGVDHDLVAEPMSGAATVHLGGVRYSLWDIQRPAPGWLSYRHDAGHDAEQDAGDATGDGENGPLRRIRIEADGDELHLDSGHACAQVTVLPAATPAGADQMHGAGQLLAPMPGRVVNLPVAAGDRVTTGQAVVVLEAMKMEHTLTAPAPGTVERVNCHEGAQVEEGVLLVALTLD